MNLKNSIDNHIFQGKIKEFEQSMIDAYLEYFGTSKFHPKSSRIICIFMIHKKLTQKQLRDLTGYSLGTISNYLSILERKNFIQKITLEGTRKHLYYMPGSLIQYINTLRENTLIGNQKALSFFNNLKKGLEKFQNKNINGYNWIKMRINELLKYLKVRNAFYKIYSIDPESKKMDIQSNLNEMEFLILNYSNKEIPTYEKFDSKLLSIENDIIDFIIDSDIFSEYRIEKKSINSILAYFITRDSLTYDKLQKLTGYSAGTISQGLNLLEGIELIKKSSELRSKKYSYKIESFLETFLNFLSKSRQDRLRWKPTIINIIKELDKDMLQLIEQIGYFKIYMLALHTLRIFPVYEKQIDLIEKAKERLI